MRRFQRRGLAQTSGNIFRQGVSVATSLEESVNSVAVSLPATAATFTQPPRKRLETSERKPETVAEATAAPGNSLVRPAQVPQFVHLWLS